MSMKLPISNTHPDFEIYQEVLNNDKVFLSLPDFITKGGELEVINGHLTIAISHHTFKAIVEEWENNKHLFETEFQDLVSSIEDLLADLEESS